MEFVLKSKGDAFWNKCFELIVTALIKSVSITFQSYSQALIYVLVAMLGQENDCAILCS